MEKESYSIDDILSEVKRRRESENREQANTEAQVSAQTFKQAEPEKKIEAEPELKDDIKVQQPEVKVSVAEDKPTKTEVFVEIDDAFQVQRIVQCRAGRMKLDETFKRGDGLGLLVVLVIGVRLVQLGLLGKQGAGSTALKLLQKGNRLRVRARIDLVLGFSINLVGAPPGGVVRCRR